MGGNLPPVNPSNVGAIINRPCAFVRQKHIVADDKMVVSYAKSQIL